MVSCSLYRESTDQNNRQKPLLFLPLFVTVINAFLFYWYLHSIFGERFSKSGCLFWLWFAVAGQILITIFRKFDYKNDILKCFLCEGKITELVLVDTVFCSDWTGRK
uniref:Uncharacterized protein n=1 Tax=Nelumbo nucifera TaxID=4432 RepID=A0A822ZY12_NELNU|nr:TPA_asm: hypothetical protein HUJ06_018182 [Nelumbo nucifera]